MLNLKPNHLIPVAVLTLASFQAAAQGYYPYNIAEYPGGIDQGQPAHGYPQDSYYSYYQPQSGGYGYDQGANYYPAQDYPAEAYGQSAAQSYRQAPVYGYDQGTGQPGYNQAYAPQQYADPQPQAYTTQQYANPQQQAYAPQQYADPQPQSYTPQQYADPQPQAYAPQQYADPRPQAYAYPQQAYQGQPYYYPYPRSSNNNSMKKMLKPEKWRGRNFGEEFWPGDDSIYEDVLPVHGPWDRNWGKAPWNRPYEDLYGDEGGPEAWMDFTDPQEALAWMWEDFLYTPNALGTMPGGWEAPSISVPNPVDVGDELKNAAGDFPGEVKDFADGFTYGDRTITGSKPKKDGGSFGMGNKKKDGINISPKQR